MANDRPARPGGLTRGAALILDTRGSEPLAAPARTGGRHDYRGMWAAAMAMDSSGRATAWRELREERQREWSLRGDFTASVAFYRSLGLTVVERSAPDLGHCHAEVTLPNGSLLEIDNQELAATYNDAFWGARFAVVADPDGNEVGLMSPIDEERRRWPPDESPPR